jgi:ABC-type branched-subunit amino acid transport system substrate-binding protein
MTRSVRRSAALLLSLLLFAVACGQKPDVAQVGTGGVAAGSGGVIDPNTGEVVGGEIDPATGEAIGAGEIDPATGQPTGGATGGGATGGGAAGGGATGGGAAGGGTVAGDRTGITDTEIRIGIHAPVTGAAPIPQNSFSEGKDIYWTSLGDKGVLGRKVKVFFQDDKFDPSTAVQKCKQMVEQDKVFLLIGGGGADQITACARYAQSVGVPYLSAGVNEDGLSAIRAYFALSTSYSQQSPLLVQLTQKRFAGKKIGIAVADSPSFNDAFASINKAYKDAGFTIVYSKRIPKSANAGDGAGIASALQTSGAEVVYFLSSPTTFLYTASALNPAYSPQFVGPGITSGLQTVAEIGCQGRKGVDKAIFLSPFPQLDAIDKVDPGYQQAYQKQKGKKGDDLGIALWGLSKQIKTMFDAAGKDMTRQSFVATLEGGKPFAGGVFPPVQYSAKNHFGGSQVHAVQADCGSGTFKTIATFASGF